MILTGLQNMIDNCTIIRQKNQSLRILVQTSDRVNPLRIMNIIYNIILLTDSICCTDNSPWFIKSDQNHPVVLSDNLRSYLNHLPRPHPGTKLSLRAIHCHASCLNQTICFSSGTKTRITQETIKTNI